MAEHLLSRTWPNISKLEHTVYKKVQMVESYQNTKNLEKTKKSFRESWLGPPLPKSLEILCFVSFFQGFYQVWGTSRKLA